MVGGLPGASSCLRASILTPASRLTARSRLPVLRWPCQYSGCPLRSRGWALGQDDAQPPAPAKTPATPFEAAAPVLADCPYSGDLSCRACSAIGHSLRLAAAPMTSTACNSIRCRGRRDHRNSPALLYCVSLGRTKPVGIASHFGRSVDFARLPASPRKSLIPTNRLSLRC